MNKHNCPNCGAPSVTVWQKLGLGALKKIECKNCGAFITVPWFRSLLVMVLGTVTPWIGGALAFGLLPKPAGAVEFLASFSFGFVLCTLLFLWLYNRYVPLVVKHA
jgi:hypothetical protein